MESLPGFAVNPTGLVVAGEPGRGLWAEFGQTWAHRSSVNSWALGDWIAHGERSWGEVYREAIEVTGLDYQTLRNVRRVCGKFPLSRRRDKLTFAHHEAVSSLDPRRADDLLERAVAQKLSVRSLRDLAGGQVAAVSLDPIAEQLCAAVRAASRLRQAIDCLLTGAAAERVKRHLQQHHLDVEALKGLVEALNGVAAETATAVSDDDRASDEDMASGRYGRRVG